MDHNDSPWVDRRMESLEPPAAWQPDSAAALARFRKMHRQAAVARKQRIWIAFGAVAACLAVVAVWPRMFPPGDTQRPGVLLPGRVLSQHGIQAPHLHPATLVLLHLEAV